MDAIGAHATPEPNDDDLFSSIVADIDGHAIEEAATASVPEPTAAEAAPPAPAAPSAAVNDPANPAGPAAVADPSPATDLSPVPSPPGPLDPAGLLAPPKPPELTIPPKPERPETGVVNWWAKAFPHIVWLSVIAGLAGQIFGFAEFFGEAVIAWIIASVLGGTFEFMMVACSSRGLRAIGLGRDWKEFTPFLVLGTGAACFAAYMNLHHFSGWLGMAAGMVSMLGYCAHVFSHLYEELEHRTKLRAWAQDKARIEAEADARAKIELAEYDAYRAEMAQHRRDLTRSMVAAQASPEPAKPAAITAGSGTAAKKPASKFTGRATKSDALRVGVEQKAATPAKLRDALTDAGYRLPASSTTIENWCKEIKAALHNAS